MMRAVTPAAMMTTSVSYYMLTIPSMTLSAIVNTAKIMKLSGKLILSDLTQTMGKSTKMETPMLVQRCQMYSLLVWVRVRPWTGVDKSRLQPDVVPGGGKQHEGGGGQV